MTTSAGRGTSRDTAILAAGAVLLAAGVWLSQPKVGVEAGAEAPDVRVAAIANASGGFELGVPDDQVTVIEFFASWCKLCESTLPALERCSTARDVRWISVSVDDSPAHAKATAERWQLVRPVAHDSSGRAAAAYGVESLPTLVVVRPDGIVAASYAGPITSAELAEGVALARR